MWDASDLNSRTKGLLSLSPYFRIGGVSDMLIWLTMSEKTNVLFYLLFYYMSLIKVCSIFYYGTTLAVTGDRTQGSFDDKCLRNGGFDC